MFKPVWFPKESVTKTSASLSVNISRVLTSVGSATTPRISKRLVYVSKLVIPFRHPSSFTAAAPLSIQRWAIPKRESSIATRWTFPPIRATIFVDDRDAPPRAGDIHAVRCKDPGICSEGGIGSGAGGGRAAAREESTIAARDRAAPEETGSGSSGSEAADCPVFPAQAQSASTTERPEIRRGTRPAPPPSRSRIRG